MNASQSLVRNFNVAIKAPRDPELRIKLIQEEAQELLDAIADKDIVAVIDALCDLLYVIYGAADVFGIEIEDVDFSLLRVEKNPKWDLMGNLHVLMDFNAAINDAVKAIKTFQQTEISRAKLKAELTDLARGCWEFGAGGAGVDLRQFFREVHRTNMHKLLGPRREDGKQLKPEGWKPPRLRAMYERMVQGKHPQCDVTCEGREFGSYRVLPHPDGGSVCGDCGGLIVDAGT